jgi:hypothetical protein
MQMSQYLEPAIAGFARLGRTHPDAENGNHEGG